MDCPLCGNPTKVTDSREPKRDDRHGGRHTYLVSEVAPVWEWWSMDFRARRRECLECSHKYITIEVPLSDLEDVLRMDDEERREALGYTLDEE